MARSHARVQLGIWADKDFVALPGRAQRLYVLLISQPDISYCGVVPYRPQRWALLAPDSSTERVEAAVRELESARFVLVDETTGELAVRTFARNDGVLDNGNTRTAFWRALDLVLSERLRQALLEAIPERFRDRYAKGSANPSEKVSRTQREGLREPSTNAKSKPGGKGEGGSTSRSSRGLTVRAAKTPPPDTLDITPSMRAWALNNAPGVDLERETEKLLDWARGKGERKASWPAAWRNWMRKAFEEGRTTRSNGHDPTLDRDRVWEG